MRTRPNPILWLALPALLGLLSVDSPAQDSSANKDSSFSNPDILGPDPFGLKKKDYEEGKKDVGGLWNKGTVNNAAESNWKKDTSLTLEAPKLNLNNLSNPNGGAPSLLDKNSPLMKPLGPQGAEGWTGVGVDVKTAALMGKYNDWAPTPGREGFCSDGAQLCVPATPEMMGKYDKSVQESLLGKAGADPKAGAAAGKSLDNGAINASNEVSGGPVAAGKNPGDFKSYNDCVDAGVCFGPKAPGDAASSCPGPGGVPCRPDSPEGINAMTASSCDPAFCVTGEGGKPFDLNPGFTASQDKGTSNPDPGFSDSPDDALDKKLAQEDDRGSGRDGDYSVEGEGGGVGAMSADGGADNSPKPREKGYNEMTPEEKESYRKGLLALHESVYDPNDSGPSGKRVWQVREEAETAMQTRTGFLSALLQAVGLRKSGEEAMVMTASDNGSLDDGAASEMNTYDGSLKNRRPIRVEERNDGVFGTKRVVATHPTEK